MLAKKYDNIDYCNHLFDNTTDGFLQILGFNEDKTFKVYNTENNALRKLVEEQKGKIDTYISINTVYKPFRAVDNVRQFRALYMDLDIKEYSKTQTIYMVWDLVNEGQIPKPTLVVDSGRGIHLYWKISNAPYGALGTWQQLEDYLYHKLKQLGADLKATDAVRVLRLPGTINSRNNEECKILILDEEIEYSMYDLREQYLKYKPKEYQFQMVQTKKIAKVSNLYNSYTLHIARANDLLTLCKIRNYNVRGYRNMIIHCFAYWRGLIVRDVELLENEVIELNNSFIDPLNNSEVKAVCRCINKIIDKFIVYENQLRDGLRPKVTKGMKDKPGYWYKNETLIELLNITEEEQRQLKTIISKKIKYENNNLKRTPRNEKGLTKKQQELQELRVKVLELKEQGISYRKIAESLEITLGKVQRLLK